MKDVVFITYPDAFIQEGELPLQTLARMNLSRFGAVHVLPFFPSSSDRGFAVTDFSRVDERLGGWDDLPSPLMMDLVFNHTSRSHPWVAQHPEYYYRVESPPETSVFRPRSTPLFTRVGEEYFWSTFGPDQLDLNMYNESLRQELLSLVRLYENHGASVFRLDAVAYWFNDYKDISTHYTHNFVKLLMNRFSDARFIAEVNLSQEEIDVFRSYVRVYNFSLAPLVLWALLFGELRPLCNHLNSSYHNYFNFLASHDGIGLSAASSVVDTGRLVDHVRDQGWSASEYELNVNFLDAVGSVQRFLLAHSLLLCLKGVPGIYFHSYFGSRGAQSQVGRDVNRESLVVDELMSELSASSSRRRVRDSINELLDARSSQLSRMSSQSAYVTQGVLVVDRGGLLCYHNFSDSKFVFDSEVFDVVSHTRISCLKPYGYAWVVDS